MTLALLIHSKVRVNDGLRQMTAASRDWDEAGDQPREYCRVNGMGVRGAGGEDGRVV